MTAAELANTYTARELATRLAAAESRRDVVFGRLMIASDALRSIARGEWTEKGAQLCAREAIEEIKRMDR